jgi:3-oxoisoapionate decarboxylase
MRIGVCLWSFTNCHREAGQPLDPFRPEDLAQLATASGLASIECAPGQFEGRSSTALAAFREQLEYQGLELVIDTGSNSYAQDITPLQTAIARAHELGARAVRTTISSVLEGDRRTFGLEGWQRYLAALVEPLRRAMALAEGFGMPVGLENHQDVCADELLWLCDQVGSPLLGVTMDVANALSVGETPEAFADKVMPRLRHVHLKDYTVHPTPSGYRLKRCALGDGVVDWPRMLARFDAGAPAVRGCIELGATQARHIRILEEDYWATYQPRPLAGVINAVRALHQAVRPADEDWRTPHELDATPSARAAYEMDQFRRSVRYLHEHHLAG